MIKLLILVFFVFNSVPDPHKTQELCERVVSKNPFMLENCRDRYQAPEMCDVAVDDLLPALKFVTDCFVTSKMIKKLHTALFGDDNILFFDEDSGNIKFSSDKMGNFSIDLLILMMLILMKMILKLLFLSDLWLDTINLNNTKHLENI